MFPALSKTWTETKSADRDDQHPREFLTHKRWVGWGRKKKQENWGGEGDVGVGWRVNEQKGNEER